MARKNFRRIGYRMGIRDCGALSIGQAGLNHQSQKETATLQRWPFRRIRQGQSSRGLSSQCRIGGVEAVGQEFSIVCSALARTRLRQ